MSGVVRNLSFAAAGLALGLSLTLFGQEHTQQYKTRIDYPVLLDVIDTIETYYVTKITEEELIEAAIEGIFAKLDPYSSFLDKQAFANIQDSNDGEYYGFGVEIATDNDQITIVTPFPQSPAELAGIMPGDRVIKLNQQLVTADKLENLLNEIKQHSYDKQAIDLELIRANSETTYSVTISPSLITINSVEAQLLDNQIGYIKLSSFQENSTQDMVKQLALWQAKPLNGLILDLRNNPGGLLDQAIKIADIFLEKGRIVATEGRFFDANSDYYASPQTMVNSVPMLVLINKGSASASEVLAAALQENGRAKLIGQTSFGKGTVQSLIPTLTEGNAIKLTIAKYTTPNGRDIHEKGIIPDIKVALDIVTSDQTMPIINTNSLRGDIAEDKLVNSAIAWIKTEK
ncbi:S41 family peptidase [Shewanella sp. Choline-02u-19]|uniref:S41 family peptidase n=1 Tax=unclassified Shewanella TaxID=196818 RepID=UPI000C34E7F0|nr:MULTISPECIES: S41 family peptidase [unclassified Shewanella]PKG59175.1 S41 family peptidase [Shewanella sp. GutDb-MelDb]PKG74702.1 S41 family peptidase [Shewanella sp. GutCb]PKH56082.1 S41 family peptidase [Shewanella sp. Bg11-22]PKI30670.1 S41 family peptidase [Shewanella sp. Choline-02u-19]